MSNYVVRRLLLMVPTLLGSTILIFSLMRLVPGDIVDVIMGSDIIMSNEERMTIRAWFGIDQPAYVQYANWLGKAVQGNLGTSFRSSQPVLGMILQRVGITAELAILSVFLSTLIAIPLGVLAAIKRNGIIDLSVHFLALVGLSIPYFWLAALLLLVTSTYMRWTPSLIWANPFEKPWVNLQQMVLPVISLSAGMMAIVMRMTRSSILEVLDQDYIRTARAKGLHEKTVLARHAIKNAAIPIITVIGLQIGHLLGGTVVVEQMFGLPGIGLLILNALYQRDYPIVQGGVLFISVVFVAINLVVDLVYAYFDPRIHYS